MDSEEEEDSIIYNAALQLSMMRNCVNSGMELTRDDQFQLGKRHHDHITESSDAAEGK